MFDIDGDIDDGDIDSFVILRVVVGIIPMMFNSILVTAFIMITVSMFKLIMILIIMRYLTK